MPEFDGQVALVTGAARGIGRAIADGLQRAGAIVVSADLVSADVVSADVVSDRPEGAASRQQFDHRIVDQRIADHRVVDHRIVDVSDSRAVGLLVEQVESEIGPIDLLAHAAGVLRIGSLLDPASLTDLEKLLRVNTLGVLAVLQAVGRRMAGRGRGAMVVIGSDAATTARQRLGAYGASKAAAAALVRAIGLELAPVGVRCNVIAPGATDTEMQRSLWADIPDGSGEELVIRGTPGQFRVGIPVGRLAQPVDIAETALFLLSQRARHITMQSIRVDGGAGL